MTFSEVALDAARDYAAEDADMTGRLHRLLKPRLVADRLVTVYETLERPLVAVLAGMERAGIKVDVSVLGMLSRDFERRGATLTEEIYAEAGHSFNIGSPKQLGGVLFDEMGLEGGKKTKQGAHATGADILEGPRRAGATPCPPWSSTGASSRSSGAPIPRRSPRRSIPRPGGSTPPSARRSRRRDG